MGYLRCEQIEMLIFFFDSFIITVELHLSMLGRQIIILFYFYFEEEHFGAGIKVEIRYCRRIKIVVNKTIDIGAEFRAFWTIASLVHYANVNVQFLIFIHLIIKKFILNFINIIYKYNLFENNITLFSIKIW